MQTQWKIGRSADNDYVISTDKFVSRYHALLTKISDNAYLLEDLNSTAGTFVGGVKVARAILSITDSFMLANTTLSPAKIVKPSHQASALQPTEVDIAAEFLKLEKIWQAYNKMQTLNMVANIVLTTTGAIVGWMLSPGIGSLVGGTFGRLGSSFAFDKLEAKKIAEIEFRAKYQCPNPKCRFHFANISFKQLKNMNRCSKCDITFIK